MDIKERLEATPEELALLAISRIEALDRELLKARMRVAMLERQLGRDQDFARIVEGQMMVLRDLLPHAVTLIDIVKAWKLLGWFPGDQLGAIAIISAVFDIAGEMLLKFIF